MNTSRSSPAPSLTIPDLRAAYRERRTTPIAVVQQLYARIAEHQDRGIWITLLPLERTLEQAELLAAREPASLPLYGIPFAIKDNIDLANVATTVACPAFAYTPTQ